MAELGAFSSGDERVALTKLTDELNELKKKEEEILSASRGNMGSEASVFGVSIEDARNARRASGARDTRRVQFAEKREEIARRKAFLENTIQSLATDVNERTNARSRALLEQLPDTDRFSIQAASMQPERAQAAVTSQLDLMTRAVGEGDTAGAIQAGQRAMAAAKIFDASQGNFKSIGSLPKDEDSAEKFVNTAVLDDKREAPLLADFVRESIGQTLQPIMRQIIPKATASNALTSLTPQLTGEAVPEGFSREPVTTQFGTSEQLVAPEGRTLASTEGPTGEISLGTVPQGQPARTFQGGESVINPAFATLPGQGFQFRNDGEQSPTGVVGPTLQLDPAAQQELGIGMTLPIPLSQQPQVPQAVQAAPQAEVIPPRFAEQEARLQEPRFQEDQIQEGRLQLASTLGSQPAVRGTSFDGNSIDRQLHRIPGFYPFFDGEEPKPLPSLQPLLTAVPDLISTPLGGGLSRAGELGTFGTGGAPPQGRLAPTQQPNQIVPPAPLPDNFNAGAFDVPAFSQLPPGIPPAPLAPTAPTAAPVDPRIPAIEARMQALLNAGENPITLFEELRARGIDPQTIPSLARALTALRPDPARQAQAARIAPPAFASTLGNTFLGR